MTVAFLYWINLWIYILLEFIGIIERRNVLKHARMPIKCVSYCSDKYTIGGKQSFFNNGYDAFNALKLQVTHVW